MREGNSLDETPIAPERKDATGQMERPLWFLLLRVAICPECDGSGAKQIQTGFREYVTREMAIDAGDPSMEGSLYSDDEFETVQCQWCYERSLILSENAPSVPDGNDNQPVPPGKPKP